MNLKLLNFDRKKVTKQAPEDRGELVFKEGTRQLKRLISRGLRIPVVML